MIPRLLGTVVGACMIGGLIHLGLAALPAALRASDGAACRYQQDLPGIVPERQTHCLELRRNP